MRVRIISDAFTSMIADNRFNPVILDHGSVVTVPDSPRIYESVASRAEIIFSGAPDLFFMPGIRVETEEPGFTAIMSTKYDANAGGWRIEFVSGCKPGTTIQWFVFGQPIESGSSLFAVRDAAGQVTYSLQYRPLRIAAGGALEIAGATDSGTYSGQTGRTLIAVFPAYMGGWYWKMSTKPPPGEVGQPDKSYWRIAAGSMGMRAVGSDIEYGLMEHSDASSGGGEARDEPGDDLPYPGTILIADVTGF